MTIISISMEDTERKRRVQKLFVIAVLGYFEN